MDRRKMMAGLLASVAAPVLAKRLLDSSINLRPMIVGGDWAYKVIEVPVGHPIRSMIYGNADVMPVKFSGFEPAWGREA